jgi:hypothetical protein
MDIDLENVDNYRFKNLCLNIEKERLYLRKKQVLLFFNNLLNNKKTIKIIQENINSYHRSQKIQIENYYYGADAEKNHSHLLLIFDKIPQINIKNTLMQAIDSNNNNIKTFCIEDRISSIKDLKNFILSHPIRFSSNSEIITMNQPSEEISQIDQTLFEKWSEKKIFIETQKALAILKESNNVDKAINYIRENAPLLSQIYDVGYIEIFLRKESQKLQFQQTEQISSELLSKSQSQPIIPVEMMFTSKQNDVVKENKMTDQ